MANATLRNSGTAPSHPRPPRDSRASRAQIPASMQAVEVATPVRRKLAAHQPDRALVRAREKSA